MWGKEKLLERSFSFPHTPFLFKNFTQGRVKIQTTIKKLKM